MKAEELSPKDLRLGNIVNYKYFNPHPENPEYCFTNVVIRGVYESSIRISFPKQKHIEKVSKVYGIPLSEELLLKSNFIAYANVFAFELRDLDLSIDVNFTKSGGHIVSISDEKSDFSRVLGMDMKLHELQNIIASFGEELEVSP